MAVAAVSALGGLVRLIDTDARDPGTLPIYHCRATDLGALGAVRARATTATQHRLPCGRLPRVPAAIRVALRKAGVAFEDNRVAMKDFATVKATLPVGQMPIIEIDGRVVTQSLAILRWAGKKSTLYPADEIDALRVDEALGLLEDALTSLPQKGEMDAAAFQAAREGWVTGKG